MEHQKFTKLNRALHFSEEKLQEKLEDDLVSIEVTIDKDHGKIVAFANEVDLVKWSEKTFDLEEEVIDKFFDNTPFSIEIHVLPY